MSLNEEKKLKEFLASQDANEWPQFKIAKFTEVEVKLTSAIQPTLRWLDGHFPENPVLPGVVQVHWASTLVIQIWHLNAHSYESRNIKFKDMIFPGSHITLSLSHIPHKNRTTFSFCETESDRTFSTGVLSLNAMDDAL